MSSGHCDKCGGLIAEEGRIYGYVGQFCHCPPLNQLEVIFQPFVDEKFIELSKGELTEKDKQIKSLESLLRECVKVQVEAIKAIGISGLQGYYHKRQEKIDKLLEFKDKPEIKAILGEGNYAKNK